MYMVNFCFISFFSSIRYHGSSSSIKCHVYHHVGGGGRRHTPVVCNERGGCKKVEFFWSKGQRSNLLIELQGSNGMRSNLIEAFGSKTFFVCLKSIDYHNVGHMLCMHARPHSRKDQLPLRSLRDLRSR